MGITLQNLSDLQSLLAADSQLILTNGCFDILHVGHVRYLAQARALGTHLLVAVNSDASVRQLKGHTRPINRDTDRAEILNALACVDFTFVFAEQTAESVIYGARPAIYAKGGDYSLDTLPEKPAIEAVGCKVALLNYHKGFSTTSLIDCIIK